MENRSIRSKGIRYKLYKVFPYTLKYKVLRYLAYTPYTLNLTLSLRAWGCDDENC